MSNIFSIDQNGDAAMDGYIVVDGYKVDPAGATIGQVLQYDGYAFVPQSLNSIIQNDSCQEVLCSNTVNQYMQILNYTTPSDGNYFVGLYIRLLSAGVGNSQLLFTDASNNQRTIGLSTIWVPTNHGDYAMQTFINCLNNTSIIVQVESSFGVTNNLVCSASIIKM